MKKNRKSKKRESEPRTRPKKQPVVGSNNHRVNDSDWDPIYEVFFDEIDQYDSASSERIFLEELDRKSRNQRSSSRRRCWSPDWDHDKDDWN